LAGCLTTHRNNIGFTLLGGGGGGGGGGGVRNEDKWKNEN